MECRKGDFNDMVISRKGKRWEANHDDSALFDSVLNIKFTTTAPRCKLLIVSPRLKCVSRRGTPTRRPNFGNRCEVTAYETIRYHFRFKTNHHSQYMDYQPNNPLHGVKLAEIVDHLVEKYGWDELGARININCFNNNPSVKSSLRFLRKTPWAREKVERLYLHCLLYTSPSPRD